MAEKDFLTVELAVDVACSIGAVDVQEGGCHGNDDVSVESRITYRTFYAARLPGRQVTSASALDKEQVLVLVRQDDILGILQIQQRDRIGSSGLRLPLIATALADDQT